MQPLGVYPLGRNRTRGLFVLLGVRANDLNDIIGELELRSRRQCDEEVDLGIAIEGLKKEEDCSDVEGIQSQATAATLQAEPKAERLVDCVSVGTGVSR